MRVQALPFALVICLGAMVQAKDPVILHPEPVSISAEEVEGGWTRWEGTANLEGALGYRERATRLCLSPEGVAWVGTSHGRLLRRAHDAWTLEAKLAGEQITGIALAEDDVIWLSTSDGMRRLQRATGENADKTDGWLLTSFRTYYEGHPAFVSGAYLAGEDAERLWGYVDDVYMPAQNTSYAPFVVSAEHGLFSWGGYGHVWHHYLPHFWGANSDWLDTRDLAPQRRPTCMVESNEGDLWIGTEGDGIVRINAQARHYSKRGAENNKKDGQEFSHFSAAEVGVEFRRVNDISPGLDDGVWAALEGLNKQRYIARFHDGKWTVIEMPTLKRPTTSGKQLIKTDSWHMTPLCVAEVSPGHVLVGVKDAVYPSGLYELDWSTQKFDKVAGVQHEVRDIQRSADGTVWARTWWGVYSRRAE